MRKNVAEAEAAMTKYQAQVSALDHAMFDPATAAPDLAALTMGELSRRRAAAASELELAEARWVEASEAHDAMTAPAG